jgi:hypothetical protein
LHNDLGTKEIPPSGNSELKIQGKWEKSLTNNCTYFIEDWDAICLPIDVLLGPYALWLPKTLKSISFHCGAVGLVQILCKYTLHE